MALKDETDQNLLKLVNNMSKNQDMGYDSIIRSCSLSFNNYK